MSCRFKLIFFSAQVFLVGFFVRPAAASTEISSAIFSDQTWDLAGSPYIIKGGNAGVGGGATLTIEPGVVVKLEENTQFGAGSGSIRALGMPGQPIIFTSIFDDAAGGDTNGDGNATLPTMGAWHRMVLGNDNNVLDHVEVKYGAYCMLGSFSKPTITHSLFEHCGTGFDLSHLSAGATMTDNTIRNNYYGVQALVPFPDGVIFSNNNITGNVVGFRNVLGSSGPPFDARGNWWGHASGPFNLASNPQGQGNEVTDYVLFDPWLDTEVVTEPPPPGKRPVLIVPGIAGTDLFYNGRLSWPDLRRMFDTNDVFLLDELALNTEGNDNSNTISLGDIIRDMNIDLLPDTDIFQDLIDSLETDGYVANQDYFVFPYDWRLNLDESANLLQKKIEQIKLLTGSSKIDIVAHSMGGLVVKDYLFGEGTQDISKLIFVGTPHLGAPKAGKALLIGYNFEIPILNNQVMKLLSRNYPSVYQILPSETYFNSFSGYIVPSSFSGLTPLDYDQTKNWLMDRGANGILLAQAENFFAKNLSHIDFGNIAVYNIAGCKIDTQAAYKYAFGNQSIGSIGYTTGDKTVPLASADAINIPASHKYYAKKASHSELPSTEGVRELIVGIINGNTELADNVSQSTQFCNINGKTLKWHSPVEVQVYSQEKHSGPMVWGLENGIDGVDYEIIDGEKFIFLPTDEGQEYQIVGKGEAQGTFDLLISDNDNGATSETHVFNDVVITPSSVIKFNVSDQSTDEFIDLDVSGSGDFQTVQSSADLNGNQSEDLLPPETQATASGIQGLNGWYRTDVQVSLSATDDNSGVLVTKYSLDGGQNYLVYSGPFFINQEGGTIVKYYSVDKAGNDEEVKILNLQIDKTPPEIISQFSLDRKDFVFEATDNLDIAPLLLCTSTNCTASDYAGNITILTFQKTKILATRNLKLASISYNGVITNFQSNLLVITLVEKSGVIVDFDQGFWLKSQQVVFINLNKPKNQSTIYTLKSNGTLSKVLASGIKFLQLSTEKGSIKSKY